MESVGIPSVIRQKLTTDVSPSANPSEFEQFFCSDAKFLTLSVDKAGNKMFDDLEMFPNLVVLKVTLEKESYLDRCHPFPSKYIDLSINPSLLQHVRTVEISWCPCEASIILMVQLVLANARVLERLVLRLMNMHAYTLRITSEEKVNPETLSLAELEEKVAIIWRSSPNAQVIIIMKEC